MGFVNAITLAYTGNASPDNAVAMEKYMKNLFPFFGLKTDVRRTLLKDTWANHKAEVKGNARAIALQLYAMPQREFHYTAIEILMKELKKDFIKDDLKLIEQLAITHSWWDSIDTIAKYLVGGYLQHYNTETHEVIAKFSASENIWLNRCAILFQLGYKKETNVTLLFSECEKHHHSNQFFIQKAIGWSLREYAKTDAEAVKNFVATANLKPLSTREALKNV